MKKDIDREEGADAYLRIMKHLPWKGDILSILFKGHLLVEELLRAYLKKKLAWARR